MLFPTIRFAIFFAIVMPASWLLMPLPMRRGQRLDHDDHVTQPWLIPVALIAAAGLLGPLRLSDLPTVAWLVLVAALAVLAGLAVAKREERTTQPWLAAGAGLVLAAIVGALPLTSGGGAAHTISVLLLIALAGLGVVRWFDLHGLTRWNVFILLASYVFYGNYDWHFVTLLALSTIANQVLARVIARVEPEQTRKAVLALAVVLNLGVLAWFKYKGFFTESASSLLGHVGVDLDVPGQAIIPPVGISFFTFQALSYVIDVYRRKLEPVPLLEFAVYLSFFPHLVAGPIVRASEFLPQLRVPRDARRVDSSLAFWLISVGLFKKVVVSSYLASAIVDPVFRIPKDHQAVDTLLGIYGYAIQIYCDFSGYTDMAIGLALLLGFRFPQNFDAPYTSASLQEFWRRWHMTLSRWLRDYLYIPLGGNQRGPNRALLNLFLTMLIGGLWHGAAWTFIVWGALHGGWLAGERWLKDRPRPAPAPEPPTPVAGTAGRHRDTAEHAVVVVTDRPVRALPTLDGLSPTTRLWLGRLVTFHVVCLGWVFFRAPSLTEAFAVLGRLTHLGLGTGVNLVVVGTIAAFLASQFVPVESVGKAQAAFSRLPTWGQGVVLALWLAFTSALAPAGVAPFIYFAF